MWAPPDAASAAARPSSGTGIDIEVEDADGPPVPPPVRRRRRRRRAWLIGAVVVVIGVPVGLAVATTFEDGDAPSATAGGTSDGDAEDDGNEGERDDGDDTEGTGDADGEEVAPPAPLDLDALGGTDAVYGRLLVDIDASERVMVDFQDELSSAFATPAESPDALVEALQTIASTSHDELLAARDRLDDGLDVDGAEVVRERYLAHLDSWAEYMDAVAEDPGLLGGEGTGAGFTVAINATADAFARALEEELPETVDASVRAYADGLLDRGFRSSGDAQV